MLRWTRSFGGSTRSPALANSSARSAEAVHVRLPHSALTALRDLTHAPLTSRTKVFSPEPSGGDTARKPPSAHQRSTVEYSPVETCPAGRANHIQRWATHGTDGFPKHRVEKRSQTPKQTMQGFLFTKFKKRQSNVEAWKCRRFLPLALATLSACRRNRGRDSVVVIRFCFGSSCRFRGHEHFPASSHSCGL